MVPLPPEADADTDGLAAGLVRVDGDAVGRLDAEVLRELTGGAADRCRPGEFAEASTTLTTIPATTTAAAAAVTATRRRDRPGVGWAGAPAGWAPVPAAGRATSGRPDSGGAAPGRASSA
jgi:hypothetical protein